jgi:hypothetical protein
MDWCLIEQELSVRGYARVPKLLTVQECTTFALMYSSASRFRSVVRMQQHGFGRGEYRYFRYPLPRRIASLRTSLYRGLAPIANRWHEVLGEPARFPLEHRAMLAECRQRGQARPTPLLLKYGADDYNCLHQDIYGDIVFPLQVTVLLSDPRHEFTGGEFVLTEQRPRMQSRVEVIPLDRGDAVVFAVHHRPMQGTRGAYRVNMRHGVSRIRSGDRYALGIIFHDAR